MAAKEVTISRRTFLKRTVSTLLGISIISIGGYSYARYIEPNLLSVTKMTFRSSRVPKSFDGVTIAQFNDTHIGFQYSEDLLKEHIQKIQSYSPDLIIFTGDLLDEPNRYKKANVVIDMMSQLKAPLGKFAVYGNHDHGGYGTDIYAEIMDKSGFKILKNEAVSLTKNYESISLSGIDEPMLGRPSFDQIEQNVQTESFHIFLSHAPDLAQQMNYFDLQLSGHSHGGQIKLPVIGPIVVPPYADIYNDGKYMKNMNGYEAMIYVNRGLGTTRMPFRLFSSPEITLITLKTS